MTFYSEVETSSGFIATDLFEQESSFKTKHTRISMYKGRLASNCEIHYKCWI